MKTHSAVGRFTALKTALSGLLRHPWRALAAGQQIYWSERTRAGLPETASVGAAAADFRTFVEFHIPTHLTPWDTPIQDLYWLMQLLKEAEPARVMEFGTCTGLATLYLAKYSKPGCVVTTLDLPEAEFEKIKPSEDIQLGMRYLGTPFAEKIRRVAVNLVELDPAKFEPQDFIFIDAQHNYDDVKRDTENALKMLSPGGTIVWHDYDVNESGAGVVRYLDDLNKTLKGIRRVKGTALAFYKRSSK